MRSHLTRAPGALHHARPLIVAIALGLLAATALLVASPASPAHAAMTNGCPSVNGDWAAAGPFAVTEADLDSAHRVYRPSTLASQGCTSNPVLIWGNGTFGTPGVYQGLLRHLAAQGFVVVAAKTSWSGTGKEMLSGLDVLAQKDADPASPFYGKVDLEHVGALGHSQGGIGAINAGADPRVDTTIMLEPGPSGDVSRLHGPALFLAGQNDGIVNPSWVRNQYNSASQVPAEFGILAGADHFTSIGNAGGFRGPVTAWLRYHLMGDSQARGEFYGTPCGQCASPAWTTFARNALALAQ